MFFKASYAHRGFIWSKIKKKFFFVKCYCNLKYQFSILIYFIFYSLFLIIWFPLRQSWIFSITLVFSVTWSFRNHSQVKSSQVELYCHSAACGDIQWNEMSCLTGPRCYINTDIQHYKPIHKLTYWQIWLGILYINVYPIQLKIKIENTNYTICLPYTTKDKDKNTNYTNYANASHKYCTCAERNIVS